jgi:hypothetical protein
MQREQKIVASYELSKQLEELSVTIYILDQDTKLCAQMLDDTALSRAIREIAQVLCNVHWICCDLLLKDYQKTGKYNEFYPHKIPLSCKGENNPWSTWTRECRANYRWMVELGMACCQEYTLRFTKDRDVNAYPALTKFKYHKMQSVIEWARDNVPDLRDHLLLSKPPK